MAWFLDNRVKENVVVSGTGNVQLGGAVLGFQTFLGCGMTNGDMTSYVIQDGISGAWEVGIGTYASPGNQLQRTSVVASSNSGSLVNFPGNSCDVFQSPPGSALYMFALAACLPSSNSGLSAGEAWINGNVLQTSDGSGGFGSPTFDYLTVHELSTFDGAVQINAAATITGGVLVEATSTFENGVQVATGDVTIEAGSLVVEDSLKVVAGNVTIEAGGITSAGAFIFEAGGTITGTTDMTGNLIQTGTQFVTGGIVLNGTSLVTGGITSLQPGTDISITGGNTISVTNVGSANGIAGLNSSGHVPLTQLPTEVQNITIGVTQVGTMSNSQLLSLIVATQTLVIPANLGSVGANGVEICFQGTSGYPAASASVLFETGTVGSFTTQGTLNISTGGVLTIANGPTAAVTIAPGTAIAMIGQATADTALANFAVSYTVQRVGS